jgi:hypothetical protein
MGDERVADDTPWLNVRSQCTYHAEAYVRGTDAGLRALRDAIDAALAGKTGEARVFASDGEGYAIEVTRCGLVDEVGHPTYLDECARELAYREREYLVQEERHNRGVHKRIEAAIKTLGTEGFKSFERKTKGAVGGRE